MLLFRRPTSIEAASSDSAGAPDVGAGSRQDSFGRHRSARLRATLLALVWVLPGFWCTGHFLAHELDSEHHELHASIPAGDGFTRVSDDHDHGHPHPESEPAVSPEAAKKLEVPALLVAAVSFDPTTMISRLLHDTVAGSAARHALAVPRPRAPPIS